MHSFLTATPAATVRAVRNAGPRFWDVALVVAALIPGVIGPLASHRDGSVVAAALAVVMFVPLVWRRAAPLAVFGLLGAVAFGQWVAGLRLGLYDASLLVAFYTVAAYRPRRWAAVAGAVMEVGAALAAWQWAPPDRTINGFVAASGIATAAGAIGIYASVRRAYLESLEDRARRAEHERDQQAQIAVAAERARIARDVHDIVTHSLSVMVALADGAAYAMPADPTRAATAVGHVSDIGRQALTDMRRLLGLLREAPGDSERTPQPGLAELDGLVGQMRAAGLPTELSVDGTPTPISPGAQLAIYRIVQEALTNTLKHAPAGTRARVRLHYAPDAVDVEVTDDGLKPGSAAGGDGHGLTGMAERAAVYGGHVDVGPGPAGGWRVAARLQPTLAD